MGAEFIVDNLDDMCNLMCDNHYERGKKMSDSRLDIERDKIAEWKMQRHFGRQDYCNRDCFEHNENCPYYDAEQEEWDFEQCFEDTYIMDEG